MQDWQYAMPIKLQRLSFRPCKFGPQLFLLLLVFQFSFLLLFFSIFFVFFQMITSNYRIYLLKFIKFDEISIQP